MPVGNTRTSVEHAPVQGSSYVPRIGMSFVVGIKFKRMVFIKRFYFHDGFGRTAMEIVQNLLVGVVALVMPTLPAIEVKPFILMEPF